jgi:hypothetical protein
VDGFHIEGVMVVQSARDLNRSFFSALRGVERRTCIRSSWTLDESKSPFFDYVPSQRYGPSASTKPQRVTPAIP